MKSETKSGKNSGILLSRADFVFTIGYDGPAAVVDGQAKKRYGSLSSGQLAEKGLFRAAYAAALFSGNSDEMNNLIEKYKKAAGAAYENETSLERLFGVFPVEAKRVIIL